MAGDLAKQLGVKLAFHQSTFATIATDVGGQCDIGMGGVSITLGRARSVFFTQPYLRDGQNPDHPVPHVAKYQTLAQIDQPGVRSSSIPVAPTSSSTRPTCTRRRSCPTRTTTHLRRPAGRRRI